MVTKVYLERDDSFKRKANKNPEKLLFTPMNNEWNGLRVLKHLKSFYY